MKLREHVKAAWVEFRQVARRQGGWDPAWVDRCPRCGSPPANAGWTYAVCPCGKLYERKR